MERFQLVMHDQVLSEELRKSGSDFVQFVHHHIIARDFLPLVAEKRLSHDFLRFYLWQGKHHTLLYRGTSHHGYQLVQKFGNDKTEENSSQLEIERLRMLGLRPHDVIYAAPDTKKAWEFIITKHKNLLFCSLTTAISWNKCRIFSICTG